MSTSIEQRTKRMIDTPLGSRVMLPDFGSQIYKLVDETLDERYRLQFIKYSFECFYDTKNKKLWDDEIEPSKVVINKVNDMELEASIELSNGKEVRL